MENVQNEVSPEVLDTNIKTCRKRIQILKQNLAATLDPEKRSDIQVQLRRLDLILDKQESALQDAYPSKGRDPLSTAIVVILLVLALIYVVIMLVMQMLLPDK